MSQLSGITQVGLGWYERGSVNEFPDVSDVVLSGF